MADNFAKIQAQYQALADKKNKTADDVRKAQSLLRKAELLAETPEEKQAYDQLYQNTMKNVIVPYGKQRLDNYEKDINNQISKAKSKMIDSDDMNFIAEQKDKIDKLNRTKKNYIEPNRGQYDLLADAEVKLDPSDPKTIAAKKLTYDNILKNINDPKANNIYKLSQSPGDQSGQSAFNQFEQKTKNDFYGNNQDGQNIPNYGSQRGSYSVETSRLGANQRTGTEGNVDDMTDIRYGNNLSDLPLSTEINTSDSGSFDNTQVLSDPQFNYRSTGTDIPGYLIDIGRTILGTKGALEDVPTYDTSGQFDTYVNEATQMRNQGLSPDELAFARSQAEKGYAYDVKNINKFAGGSSGVALANLGRASNQLQDAYGNISMRDEAVRRMNRQNFGQAALAQEDVNRQMFNDKMTQTMMNKQSGAQLANDALNNILNRRDFERYYGPGSLSEAYKNEMLKETALNNQVLSSQVDYYKRGSNIINTINQNKTNPSSINVDTEIQTNTPNALPGNVQNLKTTNTDYGSLTEYEIPREEMDPNNTVNTPSQKVRDFQQAEFDKFMGDYTPKKSEIQTRMNNAKTGSREAKDAEAELKALEKQYLDFQTRIGQIEEEQIPNYR